MGILRLRSRRLLFVRGDRAGATEFYRDVLGLELAYEDKLAAVFNVGGITLRVSFVADFIPQEHTILGFSVPDVSVAVGRYARRV